MSTKHLIVLASASARRQKILTNMGICFAVAIPNVEEVFIVNDPRATCAENAARKNRWCSVRRPACNVIAADTVIAFEGSCIGKPTTIEEAGDFLAMFSGRTHSVLTAVALSAPPVTTDPGASPESAPPPSDRCLDVQIIESRVLFKTLTDTSIREYFSMVDPMDKAGAYDIDQHCELIIESYSGSRTNIMGLPDEIVAGWLAVQE